jgi:hypothetical protein
MRIINFNELEGAQENNTFLNFIKELLEQGFNIYSTANKEKFTFATVEKKGVGLCYVQKEYFGGVSISTTHKPNKNTGTGHRVISEDVNPTVEKVLSVIYSKFIGEIYYTNIESYLDDQPYYKNKKYKVVL